MFVVFFGEGHIHPQFYLSAVLLGVLLAEYDTALCTRGATVCSSSQVSINRVLLHEKKMDSQRCGRH